MRKLITANFHRFSKDRFSWCVLGIVVILSLGNVFNSVGSFETMAASGYAVSLDEYYFNQAPLIGAFLGRHNRATKESFMKWYQNQNRYRLVAEDGLERS